MEELVKTGTVEHVSGRRVRVRLKNRKTTVELTVIENGTGWVPEVGSKAVCLMKPGGNGQGFVLGQI